MRDRREALKLLAGGTATALGASIITTSTAFADTGTIGCQPTGWTAPTPTPSNLNISQVGSYVVVSVNASAFPFNHACPASYTPSGQYLWSVAKVPANATPVLSTDAATPVAVPTSFSSAPTSVRVYSTGSFSSLDNGTYVVTVRYRATCTSGGRTCWRCAVTSVQFKLTGQGASIDGSPSRTLVLDQNGCS